MHTGGWFALRLRLLGRLPSLPDDHDQKRTVMQIAEIHQVVTF